MLFTGIYGASPYGMIVYGRPIIPLPSNRIDTHDGLPKKFYLPIYDTKESRTLGNIAYISRAIKDLAHEDIEELIEVIEPYAEKIENKIQKFESINYEALEANAEAYKKFLGELDKIQEKIRYLDILQKEDDELLQIAFISCIIN